MAGHRRALAFLAFAAVSSGVAGGPGDFLHPVEMGEAVMTATPPADSTLPPVILKNFEMIFQDLQNSPYQWLNALIALVLGTAMVFKGWKMFIIGIIYLVVATVAGEQISLVWDLSSKSLIRHTVAFECGAVSAYAAYKGIDGVMIIVAVSLGLWLAWTLKDFFVLHGFEFFEDTWVVVLLYTLFAALGFFFLIRRRGQQLFFAIISPMIGGALFSSACCYGVTTLYLNYLHDMIPSDADLDLNPVGGSWVDFLSLLLSSRSKDVGMCAGSTYNGFSVDCLLGRAFWALLFIGGAVLQLRAEYKIKQANQNAVGARNPELKAGLLQGAR